MKKVTWLLLFSVVTLTTLAQGVFSNQTNAALQKVIEDYPNRFKNIKGDRLTEHAQTVDYKSKIEIPGATQCVVTEYITHKDAHTWKCDLFESADFDKAKSRFSELYNQIHNTIIKVQGEKPFILNGKYETPDGERKFTTVLFQLLPSSGDMQKLKVELLLENATASSWKIILSVHDQEAAQDTYAQASTGN